MHKMRLLALLGATLAIGLIAGCSRQTECDCGPSQVQNAALKIGDEAPDFRLPDHRGGFVRLSDYKGKNNVVVVFFPAAFTPV